MKCLLLNFLFGEKILNSIDLDIYFQSLKKLKNVDKFLVYNSISNQNLTKLEKIYDKLIYDDKYEFYYIYTSFLETLIKYGQDYDLVLVSDTRDIIFQKNPFEYMQHNTDKRLFICAEGMKIKENSINLFWHNSLKQTQKFNNSGTEDLFVINGGIHGGKVNDVINHLMMAVTNSNRQSKTIIPDQAIYSYVSMYYNDLKHVDVTHPYTSNFCATGEAIKYKNVDVKYKDGIVTNLKDEPYYIFHQWDRTEAAEIIRNKFKNTLSFTL